MAPLSSTLAWKIPWMEEPHRLQSMGSRRVWHNWVTSLSLFTFMSWRRKLQPTPVFLPGESQGRGSLVGCRLWGCTESDTTEVTQQQPFKDGHSDQSEVILHCSFDLHFSNNWWWWSFFNVPIGYLYVFLKKCLCRPSAHFWLGCLVLWY